MNFEQATDLSYKVKWKTKECGSENCWCRLIVPVEPILYDDGGEEELTIVHFGALDERTANHIVKLHNDALDIYNENKFCFEIGDPSDDGHGCSDRIYYKTNKNMKEVIQGYKDSCKLTGVQFNDPNCGSKNYTDTPKLSKFNKIVCEYEDITLSEDVVEIFDEFGLDHTDFDNEPYSDTFIELVMEFIKLSIPDLEYKEFNYINKIKTINDSKELNISLGYGLY